MNNLDNVLVRGRGNRHYSSPKAYVVALAYVAAKEKKLMHWGKNIFGVSKFKKKERQFVWGMGSSVSFKKVMIYERTHSQTYTPAKGFFMPEVEKAAKNLQEDFNKEMDKAFS